MVNVHTDEFDVYYESHGEGPALVLLHGGGGNHAAWWQQIPHFSAKYRVLTLDLPGFGLSKVNNGVYDTALHPAAIEAVLDDAGVERAFMVSQSLGGYGLLKYATTHPSRVAGVIVTSTLGPIGDEISELNKIGRQAVSHLSVADFLLTKEFREKQPEKVGLFFQLGSFNETGPGRPIRMKNALIGSVAVQELREAIEAGMHVTILEGGADVMVYPPAYARLRELLPEANVQLVEGAPHSDYWENPDRFNSVVDEILDRVYPA
ncbi:alpha/beta hydrolase [Amycolatopsis acidicola]|uniref:Alpha/beta hydrolase n=1 Tax=Amycolatopsis acidicola TaxID=2596893 RepID=A0A5N0V386_9PSEU|nr:alpha/beta hydrolase [Amycolatopsis acidicola]KAA9159080.1 alpha/beta hydrolase [Amycolatopsis acidicola]